jgi:hypothetical protein
MNPPVKIVIVIIILTGVVLTEIVGFLYPLPFKLLLSALYPPSMPYL